MNQSRRTIVITGASDGIGAAAARILVEKGHEVILIGRSEEKTKAIADELHAPYYLADFSELQQVKKIAATLQGNYPRIDVLVNNAGAIMDERTVTIDGFEKTFQVNHLAPFLLTNLLLPTLLASKAYVIQTASIAAKRYGDIAIDNLQNENTYTPQKAYGDAKLANILFTRELQRRYGEQGVAAIAYHPGIVGTNFASDTTNILHYLYHTPVLRNIFTISPEKSVSRLLWIIDGTPNKTWSAGQYYEKTKQAKSHKQATNNLLATQLWDRSEELLRTYL